MSRVVVEPPRDAAHGDMATNAAMVLAKEARAKPRDLAEQIAAKLRADDLIASVDVAGPGFINLTPQADGLGRRAAHRAARGRGLTAKARSARARRSMSNMSRPIRPGRCMSAIAAARCSAMRWQACLQFAGYDVTREYYINDAGAQVDVLARSAYPAISRGARRGHRRDSRRALSRRLSEAGRAGAGRRVRRQAAGDAGSANGCRSCAPRRSR